MNRIIIGSGILTVAAVAAATLLLPILASTQTLPPAPNLRVVDTTYTPVGVASAGSTGSVAWLIETNTNKERYPIACTNVSGSVECKRGSFP
jgi:hypothetical protein